MSVAYLVAFLQGCVLVGFVRAARFHVCYLAFFFFDNCENTSH